jgi:MoxR-like ATPase
MWALVTYDPLEQWPTATADAFLEWRQGRGTLPPPKRDHVPADEQDEPAERSMSDLATDLYLDEPFLDTIVQLLREKKQIVIQGSPGTGKTYVARKVAKWFAGSPDRVRLVQFHPTYSYEDFVEGFRPKTDGDGFRLVNGPLVEIAEKARADRNNQYVLVIDELNRGNVARVFGELYFLLEYRDQPARLLYREEQFTLPPNLFLIATMNTVDRSIALLDSALRRRFYFMTFQPDEGPVANVLRRYLQLHHPDYVWIADAVAVANQRIADPDAAIGPSHFFRGTPIDDMWLELVWEHAVLPTLREHFHGRHDHLSGLGLAQLRTEVTQPDEESPAS